MRMVSRMRVRAEKGLKDEVRVENGLKDEG